MRGWYCCMAASRPSEVVVLPSFCRVAAIKTRGVSLFTEATGSIRGISLFSRQALAGFGVKLGVGNRLDTHNCRHAQNVMCGRSSGHIGSRAIQAKQNLTIG